MFLCLFKYVLNYFPLCFVSSSVFLYEATVQISHPTMTCLSGARHQLSFVFMRGNLIFHLFFIYLFVYTFIYVDYFCWFIYLTPLFSSHLCSCEATWTQPDPLVSPVSFAVSQCLYGLTCPQSDWPKSQQKTCIKLLVWEPRAALQHQRVTAAHTSTFLRGNSSVDTRLECSNS